MRYLFKGSKKGASLDSFYVAISFFGFAVAMLTMLLVWNFLTSDEMNADVWDQTTQGTEARANVQGFMDDMDFWVIGIYIFLHLGVIVVAFLLRSHPIIYVVGIFLVIILILVTDPLQDAWTELSTDDGFTSVIDDMPITDRIIKNLTLLEMVWGFITLIVLAGLSKQEGII